MEKVKNRKSKVTLSELQVIIGTDLKELENLLKLYEKPLFTFIYRMVGIREDAEDIYQETLKRVIENKKYYKEHGKFNKWLFGIAYNLCVDRSRKNKRWGFEQTEFDEFINDSPLPDQILEQEEMKELVNHALQKISPEQREIFLLRQHTGLKFKEIAIMVDRPLNTVLSQMRSALLSIRSYMKEKML